MPFPGHRSFSQGASHLTWKDAMPSPQLQQAPALGAKPGPGVFDTFTPEILLQMRSMQVPVSSHSIASLQPQFTSSTVHNPSSLSTSDTSDVRGRVVGQPGTGRPHDPTSTTGELSKEAAMFSSFRPCFLMQHPHTPTDPTTPLIGIEEQDRQVRCGVLPGHSAQRQTASGTSSS